MRLSRHGAVLALIASAALAITACAGGPVSSGISIAKPEKPTSPPPSLPETQRDAPHPDAPSAPKDSSGTSPKKPDQAQSSKPPVNAQPAPEGWKMVTATLAPVSFAVPNDTVPVGLNVSEDEARANAEKANPDVPEAADSLFSHRDTADLIYASTNNAHLGDTIYTLNELTYSLFFLTDELIKKQFEVEGITVVSISKEQSPLGEAHVIDIESDQGGYMTVLAVPAEETKLLTIFCVSIDKARAHETARTILPTVTK
ncbi:MAG: hypothetical protein Q4C87_01230 [Actinomycetaceae bacterium]|nr:hypothetical protein [Actinomycetaceae bacterium]